MISDRRLNDMEALHRYCLQNVLLPAHSRLFRRQSEPIWRLLAETQWWPRERIAEYQWGELQKLLKIAFESVPFYQKKYPGVHWQDIHSWQDYRRLSPLTREEVNEYREQLRSRDLPLSACHVHATGGSSGNPVRFFRSLHTYDWRTAVTRRTYSWSGYRYGDKALFLWGAPTGRPPVKDRVKTGLSNWAYNRRIISTFSQDDDLWRAAYRNMQRWRPSYLIGYVSSLLNFARYLERESLTGSVRLRAVLAAAESFDEVKRKYLQAVLGAPVLNTYGSREFMSIAGECGAGGGLHYAAENLVVETDGPEGVPGDLLITDLHNYGTVFLRYRIGDAGVVTENRCQCGRGLPMLEALGGRSAHSLEMGDGRTVSGLLFTHVLKDLPEVLQFQVVQTRADHIVISAVVSQEVSARSIQFFSNEMQRYLGPNTWEFKPVMSLPLLPSGKVQTIVPFRRENVSSSD